MAEFEEELRKLIEKYGLKARFEDLNPKELRMDLRARWKCMFGCDSYGKHHAHPMYRILMNVCDSLNPTAKPFFSDLKSRMLKS